MSALVGAEVVRLAMFDALEADSRVVIFGLGVEDPKGVFGTTLGLADHFGRSRVFEGPTAESAMSGICIGMAQNGLKPTVIHQRVEFSLLGFEQIVNQAAKWRYMTDGRSSCGVTFRMIVGKGWGQGPQHSQSLESVFGHFPGLKVYAPGSLESLYDVTRMSMVDPDPCVILEHRWLHHVRGKEQDIRRLRKDQFKDLPGTKIVEQGDFATVISYGIGVVESRRVVRLLRRQLNVSCELIELTRINPLSVDGILDSVTKTGRLLVFEHAWGQYGVGSEVIAKCALATIPLKVAPVHLRMAQVPVPSSRHLANLVYPSACKFVEVVCDWFGSVATEMKDDLMSEIGMNTDIPSESFKGPF